MINYEDKRMNKLKEKYQDYKIFHPLVALSFRTIAVLFIMIFILSVLGAIYNFVAGIKVITY